MEITGRRVAFWLLCGGLGVATAFAPSNPSGVQILIVPLLPVVFVAALIWLRVLPKTGKLPSKRRLVLTGIFLAIFALSYILYRRKMYGFFGKFGLAFIIYLALFLIVAALVKRQFARKS